MFGLQLVVLLTGVGLPLLGVIAVALTGTGAKGLADKAHPTFGTIFTVILYLSIGPFFCNTSYRNRFL